MDGVRVHVITPGTMPPANRDKLLINMHGGCYVLFPGLSGAGEAIMMAGIGHYKVIAVDYRMPPEAYFPAALDDAITVYRATLKNTPARNIAQSSAPSAGGALTLEMILKARQLGLFRMPAAIAPGLADGRCLRSRRHLSDQREGRQCPGLGQWLLRTSDTRLFTPMAMT